MNKGKKKSKIQSKNEAKDAHMVQRKCNIRE